MKEYSLHTDCLSQARVQCAFFISSCSFLMFGWPRVALGSKTCIFASLLFEAVAHVIGLGGFPQILWNSTNGRVFSTKDQDAFLQNAYRQHTLACTASGIEFMCPMLVKSPQKTSLNFFLNLIWKTFSPLSKLNRLTSAVCKATGSDTSRTSKMLMTR